MYGKIKVLVRPWGAIYINNAIKIKEAIAPYSEQLQVGTYTVRVENPNLGTWEKEVEIKPDEERDITINFNEEVTVTVLCPGVSAEIFVDNKTTGQWTPKEIQVRVGKHTIEVRREGFELKGDAKVINLEENAKVEFTLRKIQ